MAIITKSIGSTGRDYSTITLWEAALGGAAGGAGNDAVGECYDDSVFDETVDIDDGTPDSITLTVASGQRHDGTAGTGARIVHSANSKYVLLNIVNNLVVEWIEVDANGYIDSSNPLVSIFGGDNNKVLNMLLHDRDGNSAVKGMNAQGTVHNALIANNILYNVVSNNSATNAIGIEMDGNTGVTQYCYNNTVYNVTQPTGAGTSIGIKIHENEATTHITNNISMSTASLSGTAKDFGFPGTTVDDATNMSSDDTADDGGGSGNLINKTSGDQFVSTVGGSEDLHLKTGADAIDAGTDLGTTPSGVEIDIDGRDRDSEGDTWDMGADEFVAAGGTDYFKTLTEAVSLVDIPQKAMSKPLVESLGLVDTAPKDVGIIKPEVLTLVDGVSKEAGKNLVEVLTLVDGIQKDSGKTLLDSLTLVDTFSRIANYIRTLTDSLTLVDTVSKGIGRTIVETISLVDFLSKGIGISKLETLTLVDNLTKGSSKSIIEVVSLIDDVSKITGKTFVEVISLLDDVIPIIGKLLAETLTLSDDTNRDIGKILSETILTLVDSISKDITITKLESLTLVDIIDALFATFAELAKLLAYLSVTENVKAKESYAKNLEAKESATENIKSGA